jgi:cell division protein FtsZ
VSIRGARNVLVNISSGADLGMRETTTATSIIQQESGEEAEIILGTVLDESFEEELRVTVIATGFDLEESIREAKVAPNNQEDIKQTAEKLNIPKAGDFVGKSRYSSTNDPFYKGEKNLKDMDSPAFSRRGVKKVTSLDEKNEEDKKKKEDHGTNQKKGDKLLNNRRERIDKSDASQPAFLRKIMD